VFSDIAVFFSTMAVVTFGGAYAVLAWVAQAAVGTYGWLAPGEMLDGLGMAETTPGPLIMVTQFVGFMGAFRDAGALPPLLAGTLGGLLTTWVTFTPCFLWIFLGAPYIERLRENQALSAALAAITAAVVGVILNLALWFGLHVLFEEVRVFTGFGMHLDVPVLGTLNPAAAMLTLAALVAVFQLRLGLLSVLAASAAAGMALYLLGVVMPGFRFLHAADIHLDSPLRGLRARNEEAARQFAAASRKAFCNLIDAAIAHETAFVIIAGDLYDGDWKDYATGQFFVREAARLVRAGIKLFVIRGNHDAASEISRSLPLPRLVHQFSTARSRAWNSTISVVLHGRSFAQRHVAENMAGEFPPPAPAGATSGSCTPR
jgi:chromate transport protein ChrA